MSTIPIIVKRIRKREHKRNSVSSRQLSTSISVNNVKLLKRYKSPYNLIRLGRDFDGGYVVADINDTYDGFISCGVGSDISFEVDFMRKYNYLNCVIFDGTVKKLPYPHPKVTHIKKNIGSTNTATLSNINEYLNNNNNNNKNLFIKMDIEGGEFAWHNYLMTTGSLLNNAAQIVIEIHLNMGAQSIADKWRLLETFSKTHNLIHIHGNNCSPMTTINNIPVPLVFECTYLHKKYFLNSPEYDNAPLPCPLDMPNNKKRLDYNLTTMQNKL